MLRFYIIDLCGMWKFSFDIELKEMPNLLKEWHLNLSWNSNKTIMDVGNVKKATTFKSFLHLSYKNPKLHFLWSCLFNILMRQTLTNNFGGVIQKYELRVSFKEDKLIKINAKNW